MAIYRESLTSIVADNNDNEIIVGVRSISTETDRNGKQYKKLIVNDKYGNKADVYAFDEAKFDRTIATPVVMRLIVVARMNKDDAVFIKLIEGYTTGESISDYMPSARIDRKAVWNEIIEYGKTLKAPFNGIVSTVLINNKKEFVEYPISESGAYNTRGGILEATYNLLKAVEINIDLYKLDRDLVIAGAILYYIGYCKALNQAFQFNAEAILIGPEQLAFEEISKAVNQLMEKASQAQHFGQITALQSDYVRELEHIILAKNKPAFIEAYVLNQVAETSERVYIMQNAIEGKKHGELFTQNTIYQKTPYRLYVSNFKE